MRITQTYSPEVVKEDFPAVVGTEQTTELSKPVNYGDSGRRSCRSDCSKMTGVANAGRGKSSWRYGWGGFCL